jgi:uncharacterized protein (DUF486 family)
VDGEARRAGAGCRCLIEAGTIMPVLVQTIVLLTLSNIFMTFAWYGHLGSLKEKAWYIAVLVNWGIAFFEYVLQVPANRVGSRDYSVGELKILQEVISLSVFVPIAVFYLKEPLRWNYLWAALCIVGAVFFIFRERAVSEATLNQNVPIERSGLNV